MKGWVMTWPPDGGLCEPWTTAAALTPTVPGFLFWQHGRPWAPARLWTEPAALLQQVKLSFSSI